ncbi:MAG: asparagine synthase (glutamine-hydrolyzing) [Deltaproteobacteria bacterium RBG_16_47_11]|nr:MAG: asparagine synthase (glutamine-hydrolyzing) [Deltaproteobacteria bacterium RBG_16_47_11]
MCGIFGFITRKKTDIPDPNLLRQMRETMSHRGPDDKGEYIRPMDDRGPFVYFGHRRLSIIDLAGGHQPLSDEDGTVWVLLNGEIYNFQELKGELEKKGHRFQTRSDTEVIVHGYEEFGENCFERFHGMFAIAIWDEGRGRLLLARDRLGKKPLYYSLINETLLFASELKAIMAYPGFQRQIDPLSFMKYLFYEFVPCPHTIFKKAKKLPAASYLLWDEKEKEIQEYWSPFHRKKPDEVFLEKEAEDRIMELLEKAVKRRLISDVPLGIFLSGGIDSSIITALAQVEVPGKVKTFSISFEDPSFDESKYALLASQHIGTEHYEKRMNPEDLLRLVPKLPDILDEPMADASIIPTYLLSQFTREQVTVALGGDGGDELFAGYPTYLAHQVATRYERWLEFLHPLMDFLGNLLPVSDDNISFDFKVKKFLSGIGFPDGIRNYVWLGSFLFSDLPGVLSPEISNRFDETRLVEEISSHGKDFPFQDRISLLQYLDLKLYLQESILVKVDRASMANSLEVRAPFLDHELVEYMMELPSTLKLKGWTSKYLLKKAAEPYLPADIIRRKKKGFGVPIAKWVKGPLKEMFMDLLSFDRIKEEGYLNPQYVQKLLQDHLMNRRDNRKQLWTLLVWELWVDRYHPSY